MFGVGLRPIHYEYLLEKPQTQVDWFEVISENFMNTKGRPFQVLEEVAKDYPLSFHGVSLNIALGDGVNLKYLKKLKNIISIFKPFLVSDHLCWTGSKEMNLHNLLPLSYDQEMLDLVVSKVNQVQDFLEQKISLENLSAYFEFKTSTMSEAEFLEQLANKTGCGILLDINNIYVNSINQNKNAPDFLDSISSTNITEMHLAGYSDMGDYLLDTHSNPVYPEVWKLYELALKKFKDVPTLIEWDEDIPEFSVLEQEMLKAKKISESVNG